MNRLILQPSDLLSQNSAAISGRAVQHIHKVLKLKTGDQLRFGLLNGPVGLATLVEETDKKIILELEYSPEKPLELLPCTLVLSLPRPKVARRLIQTICSLGVKELHLINSYKVDKSYWQSHYLLEDQLQQQLQLGLEQSGTTYMPKVFQHRLFRPFVEDQFPELVTDKRALLAHPYAKQACPHALQEECVLVIGPEGGFTPYEVEMLSKQGATAVSVGQRVLSVETAVPALLGRLYLNQ